MHMRAVMWCKHAPQRLNRYFVYILYMRVFDVPNVHYIILYFDLPPNMCAQYTIPARTSFVKCKLISINNLSPCGRMGVEGLLGRSQSKWNWMSDGQVKKKKCSLEQYLLFHGLWALGEWGVGRHKPNLAAKSEFRITSIGLFTFYAMRRTLMGISKVIVDESLWTKHTHSTTYAHTQLFILNF